MAIAPADVTIAHQGSANGAATPATMTLASVAAGNMLVCIIGVVGTNPTQATPTGDSWQVVKLNQGAVLSFGMYFLPNAGAGSHTPSSVLAGTVTGWVIATFEFTASAGSNASVISSAATAFGAITQLTNAFSTLGSSQQMQHSLFVYAILRQTATIVAQNTILNWSASQQPQAGIQGMSMDFYFASNLSEESPGAYQYSSIGPAPVSNSQVINADTINSGLQGLPSASGLLSASVAAVQIAGWFNDGVTNAQEGCNVGGAFGLYVPQFFQGMIGG